MAATFRNDLTDETTEIETDQIVVERGTVPVDEVFQELKDNAANKGVTDIDALLNIEPQPYGVTDQGEYMLYRMVMR